ncbi:MAG: DNA-processing protein DprA [Paludibacteraceae bacterium]|nr:DNA-processing protein DprA [Paludibacteraceae bacterium]
MDDQLKYYIALTNVQGIGPVLARNLIRYVGSAEAIFHEKQSLLEHISEIGPVRAKAICAAQTMQRAEQELEFIQKHHIKAYCIGQPDYPYRLAECDDAPIVIYTSGNMTLNERHVLSVVGTRKPSDWGRENCRRIISDLGKMLPDTIIVSGLAYGIDVTAHKAALEAGLQTIAVPGHGLDRIYPAVHREVAVKMAQHGGIVTEFMSQTRPDRANFIQRNRIIAGLADATIVIESRTHGGSLITAADALSYGRDVMAVPGRIGDELAAGCNALIKHNKAGLIESAADLLEQLNWEPAATPQPQQSELFTPLTPQQVQVVKLLRQSSDPIHINDIAQTMQMTIAATSSLLLQMEFNALVRSVPGGRYRALP